MRRAALLSLILLLCSIAALAQTQASCTFAFLPKVEIPNVGSRSWSPVGINDFGTIVGVATTSTIKYGIIRWAGGGVTAFPRTFLVARNNKGITIGFSFAKVPGGTLTVKPILLNGTTISDITLNGLGNGPQILLGGINKWGTIVGGYRVAGAGLS